ncbi:MAG: 2-C-methyl-D-erythritol 2,4-cyclodiphosphate synthase [Candidatus Omnitrophica bacterium]|nr:2-C-methyl-D-erythritol 2,4-cyclodiphosphate synthase [Candidatus Omnitrophota bacterium]
MLYPDIMRIGIGFDIHRFEKGRKLLLGGVEIPYGFGLAGHSDGDVVLHALSDAIAGCLGIEDIGQVFPDTDEKIKGISSIRIVQHYQKIIEEKSAKIQNIDIVIIAEKPKISPYYSAMKTRIAEILGIEYEKIGIKAKTAEQIGEIGKGHAIACFVSILIDGI